MTLGAVVLNPIAKGMTRWDFIIHTTFKELAKAPFPLEEILEIDRQGVVHPWKPNFMLSYDIKTRTILECRVE